MRIRFRFFKLSIDLEICAFDKCFFCIISFAVSKCSSLDKKNKISNSTIRKSYSFIIGAIFFSNNFFISTLGCTTSFTSIIPSISSLVNYFYYTTILFFVKSMSFLSIFFYSITSSKSSCKANQASNSSL